MLYELRFASRILRKNPSLSIVIVLLLGLGIGANTAIFSVVNSVLLRPLPYRTAERLMAIHQTQNAEEMKWIAQEYFIEWQRTSTQLEQMAALSPEGFNVRIGEGTYRVQGARVTTNFFSMLGVSPRFGRLFIEADARHENEPVAILDHAFWQNNFGSDPNIIGQPITIDSTSYTVAGILPAGFDYHYHQDVWIPLRFTKEELQSRSERSLHVVGLLKSDAGLQQAQTELNTIASQIPEFDSQLENVRLVPLQELLAGEVRPTLLIFQAGVGFVLLIVFVNVANLLLAHAANRQREVAVRLALGAGRSGLLKQFFMEALVLSLTGGFLGVAILLFTHKMLLVAASNYLPFTASLASLDFHVLAFAGVLSVLTALFLSLVPALQIPKNDLPEVLRAGRSVTGHSRWQTFLVIAEVALSVILLAGTGLMIRSFWQLQAVNPGFDSNPVLKLRIALPEIRYPDEQKQMEYYREGLERLKGLPGVQSVAMINWLPLSGITLRVNFDPSDGAGSKHEIHCHVITPDYFRTMSIPLQSGRSFSEQDDSGAPAVAIVTQTFVRRFLPNRDPIGETIRVNHRGVPVFANVIGLVDDVRNEAIDLPPQPAIYVSHRQAPWRTVPLREFVIKTASDPAMLAESAQSKLWSIDSEVPIYRVEPMSTALNRSLGVRRFNKNVISIFGTVALLLVIIGIYGLIAYSVSRRTREIGVRMALGARHSDVLTMILRQGIRIAIAGICIGVATALALTGGMSKLLFGVSPSDPITFAAISALIILVSCAAAYIPARRATKINPLIALRYE
jgi:putative ABC transport system permease protein